MHLPLSLLNSLESVSGFERNAFEKIHASGDQVTSIRMNPFKKSEIQNPKSKIPWTNLGFYLETRPSFTFDPLFHAGCYYVQEASSMFLEQALKQTVDLSQPIKILDLCAAPGGKSTHILSLISNDSLLVSNEVIKSRAGILRDNIIKWGCGNVVVTSNDPKDFQKLEDYFDVIVVDAPCSGSGLFRREPEAIGEWSEGNVQLCSQRQQRILADVIAALKPGGMLIYSTCSYSAEEDEEIVKWMMDDFSFTHYPLSIDPGWGVVETGYGYRFWPDKVKGEGFFISCLQKKNSIESKERKLKNRPFFLTKKELDTISHWVTANGLSFIKKNEKIYAIPENLLTDILFLNASLRVVYSGTIIGEIIRDKLIPDHALALSRVCSENVLRKELDVDKVIAFLQKKNTDYGSSATGWHLVTFLEKGIGWINVLPGRVNNYYPKNLRILKDM